MLWYNFLWNSLSPRHFPPREEFYYLICILWSPISVKANKIYSLACDEQHFSVKIVVVENNLSLKCWFLTAVFWVGNFYNYLIFSFTTFLFFSLQVTQLKIVSNPFAKGFRDNDTNDEWVKSLKFHILERVGVSCEYKMCKWFFPQENKARRRKIDQMSQNLNHVLKIPLIFHWTFVWISKHREVICLTFFLFLDLFWAYFCDWVSFSGVKEHESQLDSGSES